MGSFAVYTRIFISNWFFFYVCFYVLSIRFTRNRKHRMNYTICVSVSCLAFVWKTKIDFQMDYQIEIIPLPIFQLYGNRTKEF